MHTLLLLQQKIRLLHCSYRSTKLYSQTCADWMHFMVSLQKHQIGHLWEKIGRNLHFCLVLMITGLHFKCLKRCVMDFKCYIQTCIWKVLLFSCKESKEYCAKYVQCLYGKRTCLNSYLGIHAQPWPLKYCLSPPLPPLFFSFSFPTRPLGKSSALFIASNSCLNCP